MARKGFRGKTCAYCAEEGTSEVREHVLCREMFLVKDRGDLPTVPACRPCNTKKSALETYAATVLPMGSRHVDSREYLIANLERRLKASPGVAREIRESMTPVYEQRNGLILPTGTVTIDNGMIEGLLKMIVRGLFRHVSGLVLHRNWDVKLSMFSDEDMRPLLYELCTAMGPKATLTKLDFGRDTFRCTVARSRMLPHMSVWTFHLFGGMKFSGDASNPRAAYSTFTAVTMRRSEVTTPFEEGEVVQLFEAA